MIISASSNNFLTQIICTQLYDFKYSHQILIILKKNNFTYTCDHKKYYQSKSEWTWEQLQWKSVSLLLRDPELEPHHWMLYIYSSVPPSKQDLTQDDFESGDLGQKKVEHEFRLVSCRTLLNIGSLGAMWTMLAFAKSPGTNPGDLAGHSLTKPEGLALCLLLILRPPEGGPAETGGQKIRICIYSIECIYYDCTNLNYNILISSVIICRYTYMVSSIPI